MPEVSRFLGIVIRFNYNEHLPPHFHAYYAEYQAQIAIGSLSIPPSFVRHRGPGWG